MAEGQEDRSSEDLTEEASPYRLEEFREKGQVAQSKELTGMVATLAAGVALYAFAPQMGAQMAEFMREVFKTDLSSRLDLGATHVGHTYFIKAIKLMVVIGLPVAIAGFVFSVAASFSQIGPIFTAEPLSPKFEKIDPIAGTKRLFSTKTLIEGVRIILKMVIVTYVAYLMIRNEVLSSAKHMGNDPLSLFEAYGALGKSIFLALVAILSVFALIDFGMQKWEYNKSLRMTKEEAKQEHKQREGDPMIKARIRGVQREMARKRMMQAVKKADVIVTNPTHIAIAIVYDRSNMAAPKVVAKGADLVAQRIKKVAAEAGVPLVENVPLARTLYKTVKIGQYIPRALYQAVAEVLAYVYRIKNRGF